MAFRQSVRRMQLATTNRTEYQCAKCHATNSQKTGHLFSLIILKLGPVQFTTKNVADKKWMKRCNQFHDITVDN